MTSRRGFLKMFGGATAAIVPAACNGYVIGVDTASSDRRTMFNFPCSCGEGIVGQVPDEVGKQIKISCKCGLSWELEWAGDRFKTRMLNASDEQKIADDDAVEWQKKFEESKTTSRKSLGTHTSV
jgi:formate dehydrogenase assembly factor FdhD